MAEDYRKLTREELEELAGEELPERIVLSLVNADLAIPVEKPAKGGDGGQEQDEGSRRWHRSIGRSRESS
jgi:hypothetical protein